MASAHLGSSNVQGPEAGLFGVEVEAGTVQSLVEHFSTYNK